MPTLVKIGKRKLELSNLEKKLYPSGFTKAQVIDYYSRIAHVMLPHLRNRGVTLKRYPRGTDESVFYEKQCPDYRPPWMATQSVPRKMRAGKIDYCIINDLSTLLWIVNLEAIELHVPLSRTRDWNQPSQMVFDLDPGAPATLVDCCRLGLKLRDVLWRIGLHSLAKTSGGKGLHVYVPLNGASITFDDTKQFARAIARIFERENPRQVVATMSKTVRRGKVFVDWSQNDKTKTMVCAYSLRAQATPSVSTPITWNEVESVARLGDASALNFSPEDVIERSQRWGDLFSRMLTLRQHLPSM